MHNPLLEQAEAKGQTLTIIHHCENSLARHDAPSVGAPRGRRITSLPMFAFRNNQNVERLSEGNLFSYFSPIFPRTRPFGLHAEVAWQSFECEIGKDYEQASERRILEHTYCCVRSRCVHHIHLYQLSGEPL